MLAGGSNKLQVIDGDELRDELGNLFGYTREERMKQSHVVRTLVKYLNKNDINTLVAVVAPYEEMRQEFREYIKKTYVEVYVKCSLAECSRRDVKGYFAKNRKGEMNNLNCADDTYEIPLTSDIIIDTEQTTVDEAVGRIINYLKQKDYI